MPILSHYFSLPLLIRLIEVLNQPIAQIVIPQHWPLQFPAEEIDIDVHIGLQCQIHCFFLLLVLLKVRYCGVMGACEEDSLIEPSAHFCFIPLSMGGLVEGFGDLAVADESFPAWRSIADVLVKTSIEAFLDLLLSHHFLVQLEEEFDVDGGAFVLQGAVERVVDYVAGCVAKTRDGLMVEDAVSFEAGPSLHVLTL